MFKTTYKQIEPEKFREGSVSWESPSNIALVKYWGKKGKQEPANPNLSFSLKNSVTRTKITYTRSRDNLFSFELFFEGEKKESFRPKLETFFERISPVLPFLPYLNLKIETENSFPHSAGIASSASAMSALALCMVDIAGRLNLGNEEEENFFRNASFIARLGSGSAARSVFPGFSFWGQNDIFPSGSDFYANPMELAPGSFFSNLQDSILLVDSGEKSLGSTGGHVLMDSHPLANARYLQARNNFNQLVYALNTGNKDLFTDIVENEALSLHALMFSSIPPNILLRPESLSIIEKIRNFRRETGRFAAFTIDAGPNIHFIYHPQDLQLVHDFIESELLRFCRGNRVIHDQLGQGPVKIS